MEIWAYHYHCDITTIAIAIVYKYISHYQYYRSALLLGSMLEFCFSVLFLMYFIGTAAANLLKMPSSTSEMYSGQV